MARFCKQISYIFRWMTSPLYSSSPKILLLFYRLSFKNCSNLFCLKRVFLSLSSLHRIGGEERFFCVTGKIVLLLVLCYVL